jgi:drug/metabolite transporter (DMT)-like permease
MNKLFRGRFVDLVLLVAALFWGSSYLAAKELTKVSSVFGLLSLRFLIAAAILLAIRAFRPVKFTRDDWRVGVLIGLGLAATIGIETTGISITSATNAGLIISLAIIITPITEGVWMRSFLPPVFFVAAVVAVVGVALLVGANGFRAPNWGDGFMLVAALLRGIYTAAQGRWTAGRPVNSVNLTIMHTGVAGLIFFFMDVPGTIAAATGYGWREWGILAFLVLLCTVFGFFAMMWSIRRTSASRVSLLLGTEPVWAVVVAVALGGELLSWLGVIGAILIIGGSYFGLGVEGRHRHASPPAI